ncbi:alpha-amylase [Candidatus Sumerlaeota bacterium]|nr:alpha-amylase [Candidatus Sumerlaeota bacterium]
MARFLLEINSHVWLGEQPWANPAKPDLADLPDEQVGRWTDMGIDAVWFLGVWRKGEATRRICLESTELRNRFERVLPGAGSDHVIGSPFSIADYSLSPALGNETTLARVRRKLNDRGISLILDFVPNHVAVDHPWVFQHPDRFVHGSPSEVERAPGNYFRVPGEHDDRILAHGRDPYFGGWTDTAQVNVFRKETRQALIEILLQVSEVCDGVRCDMAMLVLNDVFRRTWGDISFFDYPDGNPPEFWSEAIPAVKQRHPDFLFMAEVYWDLEHRLQEMGFDFTYDKVLYDHLRRADGPAFRKRLAETLNYQDRFVHFIENHDESRASDAFGRRHAAAATVLAGLPGMLLCHDGQFEGRRVFLPIQLDKRPNESVDRSLRTFYDKIFAVMREPVMHMGGFDLLEILPAWTDNPTHRFVVAYCRTFGDERRLIVANVSDTQSQAFCRILAQQIEAPVFEFRDLLSDVVYRRDRAALLEKGMYFDLAPGASHIFDVRPAPPDAKADA